MPTYTCSTTAGRLSEEQRLKVVESITAIHAEETGAPRYLVQVIFYEVDSRALYVGGKAAPERQIWIRGDIRSGRSEAVKRNMLKRILRDLSDATGAAYEEIWVYLCDIPAFNIAEYGCVLPSPGDEAAWLAELPDNIRARLQSKA
jgi:phenylpyruvate tautomerase PptA (4-oxalocrotonate tautomerase family)